MNRDEYGIPPATLCASCILKSRRPCAPIARQKRVTEGSETSARCASSVMLARIAKSTSFSTMSATLRSAGRKLASALRIWGIKFGADTRCSLRVK